MAGRNAPETGQDRGWDGSQWVRMSIEKIIREELHDKAAGKPDEEEPFGADASGSERSELERFKSWMKKQASINAPITEGGHT